MTSVSEYFTTTNVVGSEKTIAITTTTLRSFISSGLEDKPTAVAKSLDDATRVVTSSSTTKKSSGSARNAGKWGSTVNLGVWMIVLHVSVFL